MAFRSTATMAAASARRLLRSQTRLVLAQEPRLRAVSFHNLASKRLTPALSTTRFSSTTATASQDSTNTKQDESKKKKKEDSNIFLDNLGKIFLGAIGLLIGSLVRSSRNSTNRTKLREELEEAAALDPLEVDDLRVANSELSPDVFRTIMQDVTDAFPQGVATYQEFVEQVRTTMCGLKGEAFTVELGYLLDRAVLAALHQQSKSEEEPVPLVFLLAALSLSMRSSVDDRIAILYEAMQTSSANVTYKDVRDMVGYLQDTCQLEPTSQVVEGPTKYPTQQYERGTPEQLVQWDGTDQDPIDVDAFAAILRSRAVCAWGECYNKKKA